MGQDKASLKLGHLSNFARILQTCASLSPILKALLIRGHYTNSPGSAVPFDVLVHEDWAQGRMSTIQAGLKARTSSHYLLWPVDIPLVKDTTVQELWRRCQENHEDFDLWIPSIHQRRGHPIIFNQTLAQDILKQGPDTSLRGLFESRRISYVEVDDPAILWDLNTPEAAQKARAKMVDP